MAIQRTLSIIKPDATRRNLTGKINARFEEKGLTISGVKKILGSKEMHSIDDSVNLGVYKSEIKSTKFIKDKVKNISKIIKELKKIKNG